MRGYNKVILIGNLTKDPDVRFTPSKVKVATFTLAVGEAWKDKQTGEKKERADFISVEAWNFSADLCEKYLHKGKPVMVEGKIRVDSYDDTKTGQHVWRTKVQAQNIVLLGSKGDSDGSGRAKEYQDILDGTPTGDAQSPDAASLRDEAGFADEFPLDFSTCEGQQNREVQIPF